MKREDIADFAAVLVLAEERSFTRAAARLGMSQPTLSQLVRKLEDRLGVLLFTRTTRSVAPTEAGQRVVEALAPALRELEQGVDVLHEYRSRPMGTIRITSVEHAARTIIAPALPKLLRDHPDLNVEVIVDYSLADVVADGFDAGVRLGSQVAKDMIAVRISPAIAMAIVASPDYLRDHGTPEDPSDLARHRCINLRLPSSTSLYSWRLTAHGKPVRIAVEGQAIFNSIDLMRQAALGGVGLAMLPRDQVASEIERGALIAVLCDNVPSLPPYHLYYANRRGNAPAFRALVDALRYRD